MGRIIDKATTERRLAVYSALLQPGDVIFTANGTLLSKLIRRITRCQFSHVIICSSPGIGFQATDRRVGTHATRGGIEAVDLKQVLLNQHVTSIDVLRPVAPVSADQIWAAVRDVLANGGAAPPGFSMAGLLWLAGLYLVSEPPNRWIRRWLAHVAARLLADGTNGVTCSELVTRILERSGVDLGSSDPDIGAIIDEFPAPRDLERAPALASEEVHGMRTLASGHGLVGRFYGPAGATASWFRRRVTVRTVQVGRGTWRQVMSRHRRELSDRSDFVSPAWLHRSRAFRRVDPDAEPGAATAGASTPRSP